MRVLIMAVLVLAGCTRSPAPKLVSVSPPASLLTCLDAPAVPSGAYSQADVAGFVLALSEAHSDCQGKLRAVRKFAEDGRPAA